MGRTTCTEPQCLYNGALYLYLTVELYLYYPYGPYDLYRASVPVQGCTLPLPNSRTIPLLSLWVVQPVQSLSACTSVHFTPFFIWHCSDAPCNVCELQTSLLIALYCHFVLVLAYESFVVCIFIPKPSQCVFTGNY